MPKPELFIQFTGLAVPLIDLGVDLLDLCHEGVGILFLFLECADFRGQGFLFVLEGLGFIQRVPALSIYSDQLVQSLRGSGTAPVQLGMDTFALFSDEFDIQH
jgi:hypothetical protein